MFGLARERFAENWRTAKSHVSDDLGYLRKSLRQNWLFVTSAAIVILAIIVWNRAPNTAQAVNFATYVSGFASAVALLWLAAGFRIQAAELSLQRQELQLQRLASEQQAIELSNSAKLSSLGQIRSLLEEADRTVKECPLAIRSPTEIQPLFLKGISRWGPLENSSNPATVISCYEEWLPVEVVAKNYIRHIASAMRIYMQYHFPSATIDSKKEAEEFVFVYQSWVYEAPFLSHHIGVASLLAQLMMTVSPGLERMRLAWLVASAKNIGKNLMKEGSLEELRDKILERSDGLPAICNPWPK